jgi:hypothetical protein
MQTQAIQQLTLEDLADQSIDVVQRVMDASMVLTGAEAELRALVAKLADSPVEAEREEWKRETTKLWRQMADYLSDAVATLDGRPPVKAKSVQNDNNA